MLRYHLSDFYLLFVFAALAWLLALLLALLVNRIAIHRGSGISTTTLASLCLTAIGFSFLGLAIGLLAGLSKSPVVGVTISALLTLCGAVVSYVFIAGAPKADGALASRAMSMIVLVALSVSLMLGVDYGAAMRTASEVKAELLHSLLAGDQGAIDLLLDDLAEGGSSETSPSDTQHLRDWPGVPRATSGSVPPADSTTAPR